ncbi:ABC transporter permease [Alteromonas lipolytica]|uniref:Peptide ABC transporter permease n=1 Tax=Alteromonas lipolytica TaxID=1856405 RepID=A0A1E8FEF6_9ALTE|nr:ABC transporter permease [Alteromonas lipolytica]OFI34300.1 peptide ABC transporter permease [Alteromonas lipolytica]GGF82665.1 antimicrobial peptide ABC transporter permease SapB [Alteromonas lipolytica]
MTRILFRYFVLFTLTLLALCALSFSLIYLFPAEPVTTLTGITPQNLIQHEALINQYHLNSNILVQFGDYLSELFAGNWGVSLISGQPLSKEIMLALPATIELSACAMFIVVVIGIPLGCYSGLRAYSNADFTINSISVTLYSVPVFWLAVIFILTFSLQFGWLPLSGRVNLLFDIPHQTGFLFIDILLADNLDKSAALSDAFLHLILPTLSIALMSTASMIRITRRSIIDVLNKPFIIAAKSKGLSSRQIFVRHVLRNALLPILPLMAMQITTLITNAMIVETLFSWPGIGNWLIQAIYQRDYSALRMGMLAVSTLVVMITIAIDLFNRLIDPSREKFESVTI